MTIMIIGADGQLGTDLCQIIDKKEQIPLTLADLDICDQERTNAVIEKHRPSVVINTAAYNQVDDSETKDDLAFRINGLGAKNVALACRNAGAVMVHISTNYVFNGAKSLPYKEADPTDPISAYGISKLAGEYYVKYLLSKYFIIRTAGLYGVAGCLGKGGGNFVDKVVKKAKAGAPLSIVGDEFITPTYTADLAVGLDQLIRQQKFGLYHLTNGGECSWYEFAVEIFKQLGIKADITKTNAGSYKTVARRPKYAVLANGKIEKTAGIKLRSWQEALKAYLIEKKYLSE